MSNSRALEHQIGILRYHLKWVDIGSWNGDMGYHVTDRGYWDIELFEIGILGYQIPHPGLNRNMPSGYWDIMIKKRDIMFLKWGYWDITLGVAGPYQYMAGWDSNSTEIPTLVTQELEMVVHLHYFHSDPTFSPWSVVLLVDYCCSSMLDLLNF